MTSPVADPQHRPATLGELRASGWTSRTVKEELRANLLGRLADDRRIVTGIVGYDESVLPAIENAILAGQDLVLLGERGQAKTRLARSLINLLDAEVPFIAGTAIGPAIDDWPFPYLRDRGIAPRYLLALGLMLAFAIVAVAFTMRRFGASVRHFSPHFFALGVAFLFRRRGIVA